MQVDFDDRSPAKLYKRGFGLNFDRPTCFQDFAVERPIVAEAQVYTDLSFRMGAFSACYGGRLRATHIGRYCSIAPGVQTGWEEHPTHRVTSSMIGYVRDVHGWASLVGRSDYEPSVADWQPLRGTTDIGNDVWIGFGVFIRSGVKIGDGCVIGARSVVVNDLPPYSVAAGVPARVKKLRFPEPVMERLLDSQWWRYSVFDFPAHLLDDPDSFLNHLQEGEAAGSLTEYCPGWATPETFADIIGPPGHPTF